MPDGVTGSGLPDALVAELRAQGRGVTGALLVVGLSLLYTMETWWLGWQLPIGHLVLFALAGLGGVFVLTRSVGFRQKSSDYPRPVLRTASDFAELVVQSFVATYVVLLAFGVIELGDPAMAVVRLGLIQVVPLGFGAALANALLHGSDDQHSESAFPRNVAVFVLGALFVTFPIAPTDEMAVIARSAGWTRLAALVALSVLVAHLVLHEVKFRGQRNRVEGQSGFRLAGTAVTAYAVGACVAAGLLLLYGQFAGATLAEGTQLVIVCAFPAATGASAGEVVL